MMVVILKGLFAWLSWIEQQTTERMTHNKTVLQTWQIHVSCLYGEKLVNICGSRCCIYFFNNSTPEFIESGLCTKHQLDWDTRPRIAAWSWDDRRSRLECRDEIALMLWGEKWSGRNHFFLKTLFFKSTTQAVPLSRGLHFTLLACWISEELQISNINFLTGIPTVCNTAVK